MTRDEAGRLHELWKSKIENKPCAHQRVVDYIIHDDGTRTDYLGCKECGAIFLDPQKRSPPT